MRNRIDKMGCSQKNKGFTILECIVALAILGMGMTLMVSMFRSESDLSGKGRDIAVASLIGQKKMEEVLQNGFEKLLINREYYNQEMEFSDDGEVIYRTFRWSMDIKEREPGLLMLQLNVSWPWPQKKHHISYSTFLAKRS